MTDHEFISFLSIGFGFIASIMFIIGAKGYSNKFIAEWACKWQDVNQHLITALFGQKIDYLIGSVSLFLSFLLNFLSLSIPSKYLQSIRLEPFYAWILLFSIMVLDLFLSLCLSRSLLKKKTKQINQLANEE